MEKSNQKKRFVTIMKDDFSNFHLTKDVGMIPYYLMKDHGFNSEIWCCANEVEVKKYDNQKYVKGLKILFFNQEAIKHLCFAKGLIKEAKKIDILMLFGPGLFSIIFTIIYKLVNRKGKVYVRADFDIYRNDKFSFKNLIKYYILFLIIDLISFDSDCARNCFAKKLSVFRKKMIVTSNGFDHYNFKYKYNFFNKSNTIITIGRIGLKQKNNEMLLAVVVKLKQIIKQYNWKIYFIGPVENNFQKKIVFFLNLHTDLSKNVFFVGAINDRQVLLDYYKKSKIFCLTSVFESGPNVFPEAGYFGNMIISTNVGIYRELIENINNDINIEINEIDLYADVLKEYMMNNNLLMKHSFDFKQLIEEKYLWSDIVNLLNNHIKYLFEDKK